MLKVEQGQTNEPFRVAHAVRDRSRRALQSLTDDALQAMVDRGAVLNHKDLGFLRRVRGFLEEPAPDIDGESLESWRFRPSGLQRVVRLFQRIGQLDDCKAAMEASIVILESIVVRDPDDPSAIDDRAEAKERFCT